MNKMDILFEKAEKLLKTLKIDCTDVGNLEMAVKVIEQYGGVEYVLQEISKDIYNKVRYTPEVLLYSLVDDDELTVFAHDLANKLYDLKNSVQAEASATHKNADILMAECDVIKTLGLSQIEAWTVHFVGGKPFIMNLSEIKDGDLLQEQIKRAAKKAKLYLEQKRDK